MTKNSLILQRDVEATSGNRRKLSPDATHRPLRLDEIRLADMMAFLLLPDDFLKALTEGLIGSAAPQQWFQVRLGEAEQAGADFAVGGQGQAIAMAAKRFAHGRDDPDPTAAGGKRPAFRGFRGVRRADGPQIETRLQPLQDFAARHDEFLLPGAPGIKRHELDETKTQIL